MKNDALIIDDLHHKYDNQKYSNWIFNKCSLKKNDLVLDIGSNDGTCLSAFKKRNLKVLGIDPAKLPSNIANKNGIRTIYFK